MREMMIPIRSEGQSGLNVDLRQFRKVLNNFLVRHARGQPA
jgi:hypothetical protein